MVISYVRDPILTYLALYFKEFFLLSCVFVCLFIIHLYLCGLTDSYVAQWVVSLTIINCSDAGIVPELASGLIPVSFLCVPITL